MINSKSRDYDFDTISGEKLESYIILRRFK